MRTTLNTSVDLLPKQSLVQKFYPTIRPFKSSKRFVILREEPELLNAVIYKTKILKLSWIINYTWYEKMGFSQNWFTSYFENNICLLLPHQTFSKNLSFKQIFIYHLCCSFRDNNESHWFFVVCFYKFQKQVIINV